MHSMILLLACLTSAVATDTPGAQSAKPVWDIPDRERAERRLDRAASAVRRARAIAEGYASPVGDDDDFYVHGRHNPELFMPSELMRNLTEVYADTEVGRKVRNLWWQKGIERFGPDFWTTLSTVAAPYIDSQSRRRRLARERTERPAAAVPRPSDGEDPSGTNQCLLLAKALTAAREKFGRTQFDAFLYEVVAPDSGDMTISSSDRAGLAETALWVEGGCG